MLNLWWFNKLYIGFMYINIVNIVNNIIYRIWNIVIIYDADNEEEYLFG